MKLLDVLILIPLLWGAIHGFRKGLLIEIIGIAGFIISLIVGFKFLGHGVEMLKPYFESSTLQKILPYIGFSVIFFPSIFLINQLGYMLRRTLRYSILGSFDRFAGAIVGMGMWVFGISVFFWLLNAVGVKVPQDKKDESHFYSFIVPVAPETITKVLNWMPANTEFIQDWKRDYIDSHFDEDE